jgi:hypothetical protein
MYLLVHLHPHTPLSSTLEMEAAGFAKMLTFTYKTTRYKNPEDYNLNTIDTLKLKQ